MTKNVSQGEINWNEEMHKGFDLGMNNSDDDLCGSLFIPLYLSFVFKLLLFFIPKKMLLAYLELRFDLICKVNKFFVAWYA